MTVKDMGGARVQEVHRPYREDSMNQHQQADNHGSHSGSRQRVALPRVYPALLAFAMLWLGARGRHGGGGRR